MENEATVSQDGGQLSTASTALLSLDDLVMKVGELTVENMHIRRSMESIKREAGERIAAAAMGESKTRSLVAEAEKKLAEAKEKLTQAEAYKKSHDALSIKHNELSASHEALRTKSSSMEKELTSANTERGRAEGELKALRELLESERAHSRSRIQSLEDELKAIKPRVVDLEVTTKQQAVELEGTKKDLLRANEENASLVAEKDKMMVEPTPPPKRGGRKKADG